MSVEDGLVRAIEALRWVAVLGWSGCLRRCLNLQDGYSLGWGPVGLSIFFSTDFKKAEVPSVFKAGALGWGELSC